jgi:hypothetical protein
MRKRVFVSILCCYIGTAMAAPVFDFSGRITDDKIYSVDMGDNGVVTLVSPKCDKWSFVGLVSVDDNKIAVGQLSDSGLQIDENKRCATFSGIYENGDKQTVITYALSLSKENKIILNLTKDGVDDKVKLEIAAVQNAELLAEKDIQIGSEKFLINREGSVYSGALNTVTFCPEVPPRKLTLKPLVAEGMKLASNINIDDIGNVSGLLVEEKAGKVEIEIIKNIKVDANNSADTYGGVDFWKHNKLKMPNYNLSRNLVQNPGFEEGFKYWTLGPLGLTVDMSEGEFYLLSTDNPYSGNFCVKLRGSAIQRPSKLATFAIPIEKGQDYTISFYAKADQPTRMNFMIWYEKWGGDLFNWKDVQIDGKDWKRYSFTFNSKFACMAFGFGIANQERIVWVDDVQLEKGKLTDFDKKQNGVCLITGKRGNLVEPGTQKDSFFRLSGQPGAQVEHQYKVEDIFDNVLYQGSKKLTLNKKGMAKVAVSWVPKLPNGIYSIESNIIADDVPAVRDFDRVVVMPSSTSTPTKNPLFFADNISARFPNWQRRFAMMKYFGMDTILNFSIPSFDEDKNNFKKAIKKAGLFQVGCLSSDGYDRFPKTLTEPQKDINLEDVEQHAYTIAKKHSDITAWKTINEPHTLSNEDDMKAIVKYVEMLSKGAKRLNPENLVITPDPANMYPQYGAKYIDLFLQYGGGEFCDIIGIHPYRGRPESPDLDKDIDSFLKMLDRHNVTKDVWFTEGIYHCNYVLPPYSLNAHAGCSSDHFRTGNFSYHIGWGEKISFAYTIRSWIMELKYGDRVKMSVDWVFGQYCVLDYDLTPAVKSFAPNTLKQLICMADYKNDLGFGRDVRGYMFEDDKKRPIAVIWTYNYLIDTGKEKGVDLDISKLPADVEIMNCFGAPTARSKDNLLTLNSFPLFIRGKAGSIDELNAAFKQTAIVSEGFKQTFMSVKVVNIDEREFALKNMIPNLRINGQIKLSVDGKLVCNEKISVAGDKTWSKKFKIESKAGKVQVAKVTAEFLAEQSKTPELFSTVSESLAAVQTAEPIIIDGDLTDWPESSMVTLEPRYKSFNVYLSDHKKAAKLKEKYPDGIAWKGEDDLSGKLYLAWNADNLYIAFNVKDDKLNATDKLVSAWMGDSMQIYFDGWGDAKGKYTKGFDINDQVFDLWPNNNKVTLRRVVAPEQQLGFLKTGVVDNAKTAFKKTSDGYIMEIAIPAKDVFPVKLYKGSVFGFAAMINDNDVGFRHQGLTTTPNNTEPYPNPHLYPTVILK